MSQSKIRKKLARQIPIPPARANEGLRMQRELLGLQAQATQIREAAQQKIAEIQTQASQVQTKFAQWVDKLGAEMNIDPKQYDFDNMDLKFTRKK